jgi:hypothetical protein
MEIEIADILISLSVVALFISIILSLKAIFTHKSLKRRLDSDAHFIRSKLIQIEFEVKDFRRAFQTQSIHDRKKDLARNRFESSENNTAAKIQPFVALKTQGMNLENVP